MKMRCFRGCNVGFRESRRDLEVILGLGGLAAVEVPKVVALYGMFGHSLRPGVLGSRR